MASYHRSDFPDCGKLWKLWKTLISLNRNVKSLKVSYRLGSTLSSRYIREVGYYGIVFVLIKIYKTSKKTMGFFCVPTETLKTEKTVIFRFWRNGMSYRVKCLVLESIWQEMASFDPLVLNSWLYRGS